MFLNHEEIASRGLISFSTASQFSNASYNLRVNYIIDMDGKNIDDDNYRLKPQGMVYVVFKEVIQMQDNVIAFAHVKTSLTKRGIMATNIGIVDPTYQGLISTLLINFGKSDFIILKEDPGLRISFAEIRKPSQIIEVANNNQSEDEYIKSVQKDIASLDEKFLNLNKIEDDVTKSVFNSLTKVGLIFGAFALATALWFQTKNSESGDLERAIKKYEIGLQTQEDANKLLLQKIAQYEVGIQVRDSLLRQRLSLHDQKAQERDSTFSNKLLDNEAKLGELKSYIDKQIKNITKK